MSAEPAAAVPPRPRDHPRRDRVCPAYPGRCRALPPSPVRGRLERRARVRHRAPRRGGRGAALRSRPRQRRAGRAVPPRGALWRPVAVAGRERRRADRHRERDPRGGRPARDPRGKQSRTDRGPDPDPAHVAGQRQPRRGRSGSIAPASIRPMPPVSTASPTSTRTSASPSRRWPRPKRCSTPARSRAATRWSPSTGCSATATACAASGSARDNTSR